MYLLFEIVNPKTPFKSIFFVFIKSPNEKVNLEGK